MTEEKLTLKEFHKKIAMETNNAIWSALDKDDPTTEELEEAMFMAYTSTYHWGKIGTLANAVRGYYMIARVHAKKGRADPALHYAKRCLELAEKAKDSDKNFNDWDLPFVYEVLARAYAVAGKKTECKKYKQLSQKAIDEISDPEDKKLCQGELDKFDC